MLVKKIISGGQIGADSAALDFAIEHDIPHGGWCPKGRLAELGGIIPEKYLLTETQTSEFSERTKLNIQDSNGTLIFVPELPLNVMDGTILTIKEVKDKGKPHFIVNLSIQDPENKSFSKLYSWIQDNKIDVLNIAGPRESQSPGIYESCYRYLNDFLIFSARIEFLSKTNR